MQRNATFWHFARMLHDATHAAGRRSCDAAKGDRARQAGPLNERAIQRAARDTCAPRAVRQVLAGSNPLKPKDLRSVFARGARRSRDTSAARRLSNEFSFLPAFIGPSDDENQFIEVVNIPPPVVYLRNLFHKSCIKMHHIASLFQFFARWCDRLRSPRCSRAHGQKAGG